MGGYVPHTVRHGGIPVLRPITVKVADLSDADFPEINAAIDYARRQRIANDG